jgi:hypothetical protein
MMGTRAQPAEPSTTDRFVNEIDRELSARSESMLSAWVGVWVLGAVVSTDPSVSTLNTRGIKQIERTDTSITIVDDLVRARGGVLHLEWTGKFDGRDYPVEGIEADLTISYRQIDDHTLGLTQKLDGVVVVTGTVVLSPDGTMITTTTSDGASRSRTVYTKRP